MSFTQITSTNLSTDLATQIAAGTSANAAVANIVSLTVKSVQVANSSYTVLDDTAANTGGGYIVLTGTGFTPNCVVIVGQTNATSTTYANTTSLRAQVPAASAATYNIYVVDSYTGATAIKVNGLTYSSIPVWGTNSTLTGQSANTSFGVSLSATSDTSVTYANTTALPDGTALLANGYFYGTVTIGATTTYSFDVSATDAEYQDATRTFSLTVSVTPQTKLWLWGGSNSYGQLGNNTTTNLSLPTQIGTATTWNNISMGNLYVTDNHSLATKTDGTMWAWGRNSYGQLGDSSTVHRSSPVQIAGTSWSKVFCGALHSFAIKSDGTLWSWGVTNDGRLGDGVSGGSYKSSPAQVGSATTWDTVSGAEKHNVARRTDGTLWVWGAGADGRLGTNNTSTYTTPTQLSGTWSKGVVGARYGAGIKSDGTLWLWGYNGYGQLGTNSTIFYSSPVQIGSGTNWSFIGAGFKQTYAIKSDGTLWAWGYNGFGLLGLNDGVNAYRSSPCQVGALTNWSKVISGASHTLAIKTDGTLWGWGYNNDASRLGNGIANVYSSPIQIGSGTNWNKIEAGAAQTIAITSN